MKVYIEKGVLRDHSTHTPVRCVSSYNVQGGPGVRTIVGVCFADGDTATYDYQEPTYTLQTKEGKVTKMGCSAHEVLAGRLEQVRVDETLTEDGIAIQLSMKDEPEPLLGARRIEMCGKVMKVKDGVLTYTGQNLVHARMVSNHQMVAEFDMMEEELEDVAKGFGLGLLAICRSVG